MLSVIPKVAKRGALSHVTCRSTTYLAASVFASVKPVPVSTNEYNCMKWKPKTRGVDSTLADGAAKAKVNAFQGRTELLTHFPFNKNHQRNHSPQKFWSFVNTHLTEFSSIPEAIEVLYVSGRHYWKSNDDAWLATTPSPGAWKRFELILNVLERDVERAIITPQDIGNLYHSLCHLRYSRYDSNGQPYLARLMTVANRILLAHSDLKLGPKELSDILYGCHNIGIKKEYSWPLCEVLLTAIVPHLLNLSQNSSDKVTMTPWLIANAMTGLRGLNSKHVVVQDVISSLTQQLVAVGPCRLTSSGTAFVKPARLNATSNATSCVSFMLYGLRNMSAEDPCVPELIEAVYSRLVHCPLELFGSVNIVKCLSGIQHLGSHPCVTKLRRSLVEKWMQQREGVLDDLLDEMARDGTFSDEDRSNGAVRTRFKIGELVQCFTYLKTLHVVGDQHGKNPSMLNERERRVYESDQTVLLCRSYFVDELKDMLGYSSNSSNIHRNDEYASSHGGRGGGKGNKKEIVLTPTLISDLFHSIRNVNPSLKEATDMLELLQYALTRTVATLTTIKEKNAAAEAVDFADGSDLLNSVGLNPNLPLNSRQWFTCNNIAYCMNCLALFDGRGDSVYAILSILVHQLKYRIPASHHFTPSEICMLLGSLTHKNNMHLNNNALFLEMVARFPPIGKGISQKQKSVSFTVSEAAQAIFSLKSVTKDISSADMEVNSPLSQLLDQLTSTLSLFPISEDGQDEELPTSFTAAEVARMLSGLQNLSSEYPSVTPLLAALVPHMKHCRGPYSQQNIGMTLFALRNFHSTTPVVLSVLSALHTMLESKNCFLPSSFAISNAYFGLQNMYCDSNEVIQLVNWITKQTNACTDPFQSRGLSSSLYGFRRLGMVLSPDVDMEGVHVLAAQECVDTALLSLARKLAECRDDFSRYNVVSSLAGLQHTSSDSKGTLAIFEALTGHVQALAQAKGSKSALMGADIVNCLHNLRNKSSDSAVIRSFIGAFVAALDHSYKSGLQPQDMVALLNGLHPMLSGIQHLSCEHSEVVDLYRTLSNILLPHMSKVHASQAKDLLYLLENVTSVDIDDVAIKCLIECLRKQCDDAF